MKVYALIDKKTNQIINIYKYFDVANQHTKQTGVTAVFESIKGTIKPSELRIEVYEVIE